MDEMNGIAYQNGGSILLEKVRETVQYIEKQTTIRPKIGIVLGSGLGGFVDQIEDQVVIPYEDIPHFPISTAPGHRGRLVLGRVADREVLCMQGRFHYYEGYSMQEVTYPVRVMQRFGVQSLILTNAAGGLDPQFVPGDLMVIRDHINFLGTNPLIGPNEASFGERFIDMSKPYALDLIETAKRAAKEEQVDLKEGVYVSYSGPSFETAAEIKMFQLLGGSAVGMSTVPEVIVANHSGVRVLAISCITNLGTGILDQPLSGEEVMVVAAEAGEKFQGLLKCILQMMPEENNE